MKEIHQLRVAHRQILSWSIEVNSAVPVTVDRWKDEIPILATISGMITSAVTTLLAARPQAGTVATWMMLRMCNQLLVKSLGNWWLFGNAREGIGPYRNIAGCCLSGVPNVAMLVTSTSATNSKLILRQVNFTWGSSGIYICFVSRWCGQAFQQCCNVVDREVFAQFEYSILVYAAKPPIRLRSVWHSLIRLPVCILQINVNRNK